MSNSIALFQLRPMYAATHTIIDFFSLKFILDRWYCPLFPAGVSSGKQYVVDQMSDLVSSILDKLKLY